MRAFPYRALQWLTRKIVPVYVEGDGSEVQTDRGEGAALKYEWAVTWGTWLLLAGAAVSAYPVASCGRA
jgi:hypothetical protein